MSPEGAASYELPCPPSTNALYANVPGKGRKKTAAYRAWASEAGWTLRAALAQPLQCQRFGLMIRLSKRGIDADNAVKAISDLFVSLWLVPDDRHMAELHVYRDPQIARGRCQVSVWALEQVSPERTERDREARRLRLRAGAAAAVANALVAVLVYQLLHPDGEPKEDEDDVIRRYLKG